MASAAHTISTAARVARILFGLFLLGVFGVMMMPGLLHMAAFNAASGGVPEWVIDVYSTVFGFVLSLIPFGSTGYPAVQLAPGTVYPRALIMSQRAVAANVENIRHLRIVGVSYVDRKSSFNLERGGGVTAQATVHLGARADRAVVFLTNDHVRWTFTGAGPVGFHGATPLELRTPPAGLTAELRVYERSNDRVSGPLDAVNAPGGIRSRFCTVIASWRSHYRLEYDAIDYVELSAPRSIMISDNSAMGDGRFGNYLSGKSLKQLCG